MASDIRSTSTLPLLLSVPVALPEVVTRTSCAMPSALATALA